MTIFLSSFPDKDALVPLSVERSGTGRGTLPEESETRPDRSGEGADFDATMLLVGRTETALRGEKASGPKVSKTSKRSGWLRLTGKRKSRLFPLDKEAGMFPLGMEGIGRNDLALDRQGGKELGKDGDLVFLVGDGEVGEGGPEAMGEDGEKLERLLSWLFRTPEDLPVDG